MLIRHILVIGAMFATANVATAATVVVNAGTASVSTGGGYSSIPSGTEVGPGSKLIVSQGGSATIVYSSACQVSVSAGQVVTIPAQIPCTAGPGVSGGVTTYVIGGAVVAGGVGAAIALSGDDKKSISP